MGGHLLGIDIGNTMVKAVLFDVDGRERAIDLREGGTRQPRPSHVERDVNGMLECVTEAVRGCLERSGVPASDVLAVGCAGHGNGVYLLDVAGDPLLGIQSLDGRATTLVEEWNRDGTSERLYPLCLQKPWPSQTATLLAWLKRQDSQLFNRIGHALFCKDVIVHFLSGRIGSDFSDASAAGLLRLPQRRYDDETLAAYGLDSARAILPQLAEPTEIVGHVTPAAAAATGLLEGTPVVAGLIDVIASAIGCGAARPGEASIVAGSWSINQVVTEAPIVDPAVFLSSTFRRDRYMAIEASATSAANLEWFVHEMMADTARHAGRAAALERCGEMVRDIAPSQDLPLFHPYLYGSTSSRPARAGFYGIGGWHGLAQLAYAVFEGVVFAHRRHVAKLRAAGALIESAVLSGGASRSEVWTQMFADVLSLPIATAASTETGALGAAVAAAVGVRSHADLDEAVSRMSRRTRLFEPRQERASVFAERFRQFEEIAVAMGPIWAGMAQAHQV